MDTPLILICDDAPPIAAVLSHLLQAEGWRTQVAKGALEAISLARKCPPALILMDIVMPGLDGATAADLLHDTVELADIPVLLISGLPEEELRTRAEDSRAKGYVVKPFTKESLLEAVRKQLPAETSSAKA